MITKIILFIFVAYCLPMVTWSLVIGSIYDDGTDLRDDNEKSLVALQVIFWPISMVIVIIVFCSQPLTPILIRIADAILHFKRLVFREI